MSYNVALVLGILVAIAATVLLYIKILPKKLDGTFYGKLAQFIHDFFHFKRLYLEDFLKGIYTLATVACITCGSFLLIGYEEYWSYWSDTVSRESTFLYGLLLMVCGPIALRLTYEALMMGILLVKNVIELNNKVKAPKKEETPAQEPVQPVGE